MENLQPCKIFLSLFLLLHPIFILHLPISSAYTVPDHYFITCGSSSDTRFHDRTFVRDVNPDSFSLSARDSYPVEATNPPEGLPVIYQTARIFRKPARYELDMAQNGTYVVRLHFYPFTTSSANLVTAIFNVSTPEFTLLSNFGVPSGTKLPSIQEFLISLKPGKFIIEFKPFQESSVAFISALEAFLAPDTLVADSATFVTPTAGNSSTYHGLLSHVLHVSYRINVGGKTLTAENDTLGRNWVPDDDYLVHPQAGQNFTKIDWTNSNPNTKATSYDAPDQVYSTAKGMDIDSSPQESPFNITWRFNVGKNATFHTRFHFCDVVSKTWNLYSTFNLYIYGKFARFINTNSEVHLQAPFYLDFVVKSDDSGVLSISIGLRPNSRDKVGFLNGIEIKELIVRTGNAEGGNSKKWIKIVASVAGGLAILFILVVMVILVLRRRKQKCVKKEEWQLVPLYGGTSHGCGSTERNGNASTLPHLTLRLKLAFADILYATKNFDKNLLIGEGGFGKVYKGILPDGVTVAVKRSEPGHGQGLPEFHTEINLLSRIRHRHLVSLIGYCDEGKEMILVYEFLEKGTLRDHLFKENKGGGNVVAQSQLSWQQRLEICIGAARGLHYLHAGLDDPIIHRDVKSTNILLDENLIAKVSDFGLSRSGLLDESLIITNVKGSIGYLDPEYYTCAQLTKKSDVYSFGVVLLEVLCARPAVNNLLPREEANLADWGRSWIKEGQLEEIIDPFLVGKINPNSLRKFGETVEKCLKQYGDDRPNMADVLSELEYARGLQLPSISHQPHENSTTDVSLELPSAVINRLPSLTMSIGEHEMSFSTEYTNSSYIADSQVFSQLKLGDAR